MAFDFDTPINRINTHSNKWDSLETYYGVKPDSGIAMWVADMDFQAPPAVTAALQREIDHGVYGYYGDYRASKAAITGWMQRRHGWHVEPDWIATVHGLVAGIAVCIQAFTEPDDGVILFTPVYHAFARMIRANNRVVVESPMPVVNGRYEMDLEALAAQLKGHERMLILCSPHNPGGRVWDLAELRALADFCVAHDLILVADEVHHDLVFPGHKHIVMANAAPEISDRLVMMSAVSKTFNLAGGMSGNVIIQDDALRARFDKAHQAAGTSPNRFGLIMSTAAYDEGEAWLDSLITYLDTNRRIFDAGMNAIPGVRSTELASTYLAWVDFSGTGMELSEVLRRTEQEAQVVGNHGPSFGTGGENFVRFNFATRRALVEDAVERLQRAFSDLQ